MKKIGLLHILVAIVLTISFLPAEACTSAIFSGRATKSGRPLMWKHRDTSKEWNHIEHMQGKRFAFTGLVNSSDKERKSVWAGVNERGFAIMNTASYNLRPDSLENRASHEGVTMRLALGECATVDEFEQFIKDMPQPRLLETNFGVIDAEGGAAYFEVWDYGYKKYDVNDAEQYPDGYVIRTNHSFTGAKDEGKGYIRYQNTEYLLHKAYATNSITPEWIFSSLSRSYYNAMLGDDVLRNPSLYANGWAIDMDFIPRNTSSASTIIEGVNKGENPDATTLWSILGYPPCSYAVAAWVKAGDAIAEAISASDDGRSRINRMAVGLKREVFPIKRGNGPYYMRMDVIANSIEVLRHYEDMSMRAAASVRDRIAREGFDIMFVKEYNKFIDSAAPNPEDIVSVVMSTTKQQEIKKR